MPLNLVSDKEEHEKFVSNLQGTSPLENFFLLTLPILLNTCISFWSINLFQLGLGDIKGNIVINFLAVCVPFICSVTIFNQHLDFINGIVILLSTVAVINSLLLSRANRYSLMLSWRVTMHDPTGCINNKNLEIEKNRQLSSRRLLFLSQMRGLVLLVSGICIMAVDVPVFPRRFAKTEWCGLGPMDLGVGLFAAVSGLLERRLTHNYDNRTNKVRISSINLWKSPAILIALGLIRVLIVKAAGYPEHEGEYGRHWNFFFTLAVIRVVAIVTKICTITYKRVMVTLLVLGCLHHAMLLSLSHFNTTTTPINSSKVENTEYNSSNETVSSSENLAWSILLANKQGLVSLPGYIMLWLVGVLGDHCVTSVTESPSGSSRDFARLLAKLLVLPTAIVLMLLIVSTLNLPISLDAITASVSRRVANVSYVIWTSASLCWCLFLLVTTDLLRNWLEDRANYVTNTHFPDLLCVINSRAMLHFLVANLATGVANMLVNTLHLSAATGLGLVVIHTATAVLAVLAVLPNQVGRECISHSHID